jgi:hypothetical protein
MVMTSGSLSREEALWWHNPCLLRDRDAYRRYLERGVDWCKGGEYAFRNHVSYTSWRDDGGTSLSPVGELPILLFLWGGWKLTSIDLVDTAKLFEFDKEWRFSRTYINDRSNWVDGKLQGAFNGPDDPAMTTLDRVLWVLNDPRSLNLDEITDTDDTVRLVRLIQTAYQRFVCDEVPSVPSLWKEGDQVMCGWNDLFADDGRSLHAIDSSRPFGGMTPGCDWREGAVIEKPETWRWRVPK